MKIFIEWVLFIALIVLPITCLIKLCVTYLFNLKNRKEKKQNEKNH